MNILTSSEISSAYVRILCRWTTPAHLSSCFRIPWNLWTYSIQVYWGSLGTTSYLFHVLWTARDTLSLLKWQGWRIECNSVHTTSIFSSILLMPIPLANDLASPVFWECINMNGPFSYCTSKSNRIGSRHKICEWTSQPKYKLNTEILEREHNVFHFSLPKNWVGWAGADYNFVKWTDFS